MRCLSCDKRLNEREATRKYSSSGSFIDLCDRCFATVAEEIPDIEENGNEIDLDPEDGVVDEWDYQQFQRDNYTDE